ncbi:MAG: GntR family transcriptional regulator [Eggerthellaceae bacterium]|nr:GntR family transcriptional regulator [Eggerthellaceae bacterium]
MSAFENYSIDKKSDIPVWVQLRQRLSFCIMSGIYKEGDQLPTVRELAAQLDVHYHTVNKVYRDLETSGLVEMRSGRGTFVADLSESRFRAVEGDVQAAVAEYATKLLELGMTPEEAVLSLARHLGVAVTIDPADASAANEPSNERKRRAC